MKFADESFGLKDNREFTPRVVKEDQLKIERDMKTFSAVDYMNEYYTTLSPENLYLMDWYSEVYDSMEVKEDAKLLEIGGGPTVYQLISAADKVKNITFTDYVEGNLEAVRQWMKGKGDFWDKFVEYALEKEGKTVSEEVLNQRKNAIIDVLKQVEQLDASELKPEFIREFDIIQSNFCLESATDDIEHYKKMLRNLSFYVKKGGTLLMSALDGARAYKVAEKHFPAIYLDEALAAKYLDEAGFEIDSMETIMADDPEDSKYRGFLFIKAKRR
jgi:hypothetical protein